MEKEVRPIQELIGSRLKELRKARNMDRGDVAEILNCSYNSYCRYEAGSRKPSYEVLLNAAEYYGVSVDFMLGHTPAEGEALTEAEIVLLEHFRNVDNPTRENVLDLLDARFRKLKA